jgi:hypothetical protein
MPHTRSPLGSGGSAGFVRQCPRPLAAASLDENRRGYLHLSVAWYATWSLAAGVDIFTLARRMGTSVKMIDRTYGHLVAGADVYERELLDAFDEAQAGRLGRAVDAQELRHAA